MWKKMAGRLFELQSRNGILEEKDRRLYEYAYGVLLGRVVIYLIIVILGIITGNWMEMIVFLLPFTVLRQYAGGIHLEKAGGCMAVSGILVLLCSLYLASAPAVIWQMRIIWFVAVGVIFISHAQSCTYFSSVISDGRFSCAMILPSDDWEIPDSCDNLHLLISRFSHRDVILSAIYFSIYK